MADKISTIILNVDLKGCNCDKRIKKTLCKLQERENIHTIAFDEKKNTVTISGPFDPDKICKKLCCKAGKVIIGIEIKDNKEKPKEDTKPPVEEKPKEDTKPPVKEEEPKPAPKPSEAVKVEQSVVVQVTQLGYQPPVWQPGTSCGCGCRCGGCRNCPSWAPAYKTCTFFYPQSSCSVMCNCRFH